MSQESAATNVVYGSQAAILAAGTQSSSGYSGMMGVQGPTGGRTSTIALGASHILISPHGEAVEGEAYPMQNLLDVVAQRSVVETSVLGTGVKASKNQFGVVTVSIVNECIIPACGRWEATVIGTLPEGWRPAEKVVVMTQCHGVFGYFFVETDGKIKFIPDFGPIESADAVTGSITFVATSV